MDESLNLVLFSGTDDKLQAAAVLTAGAAALAAVSVSLLAGAAPAAQDGVLAILQPGSRPALATGSAVTGAIISKATIKGV